MTRYTTMRTQRGALHIATRTGAKWATICLRAFGARRKDLIVYRGGEALRAFQLELRCQDCEEKLALSASRSVRTR